MLQYFYCLFSTHAHTHTAHKLRAILISTRFVIKIYCGKGVYGSFLKFPIYDSKMISTRIPLRNLPTILFPFFLFIYFWVRQTIESKYKNIYIVSKLRDENNFWFSCETIGCEGESGFVLIFQFSC